MTSDLSRAIKTLDAVVRDPTRGLPEDVFLFVSRMTPLVNVNLLIEDPEQGFLLTWRDDGYYGAGWHVPGGIIRLGETMADRICATARGELGAEVDFQPAPLAVNEGIFSGQAARGHFISLLYRCTLLQPPAADLQHLGGSPRRGQWRWHESCPPDLLSVQRVYAPYLNMA